MAHLRNAGKQHLADLGRKAVPVLINNLRYDDPDLLIHTLNVLGDIGDESAIPPIRKLYGKRQLPIITVTTQNECQDNDAARAAGVNAILHKPFNEDALRRVMEEQLTSGGA